MKLGLDRTPVSAGPGGLARYTVELHRALARQFPADEFVLLDSAARRWWLVGLPLRLRREQFTLFHGTNFEVPYVPVTPTVMTLHDLSPWKQEPWQAASARVRERTPWLLRLGLATLVTTPSEAVRREAIRHFQLDPSRVVAVPEAAAERFTPAGAGTPDRFLLCVGTEARKNLAVAENAARQCGYDLMVVGKGARQANDAELADLYRRATALLYPSFYEGFGLPVLEAMQSGTAVIASKDPALVEVSGGAALHVDASDAGGWVEAVRAMERDRAAWVERGLRRAREFSWERTAFAMHAVYMEAIARFRRRRR
ncbi:MAG: glycosyltransferase family 1 protein [Bryobacteraceae bacterium]